MVLKYLHDTEGIYCENFFFDIIMPIITDT